MSTISEQITSIKQNLINAYNTIEDKGVKFEDNKNIQNLANAINQIQSTQTDIKVGAKTITPSKQETIYTPANDNLSYYSSITVEAIPDQYIIPEGTENISANGLYDITQKAQVSVNIQPKLQEKTDIIPKNAPQTIIPDSGYDGLSEITISAVPIEDPKSVTPTKLEQIISPVSGKWLSEVTVSAIPDEYVTTVDANAAAADILLNRTAYVNGEKVTGSIETYDDNKGTENIKISVDNLDSISLETLNKYISKNIAIIPNKETLLINKGIYPEEIISNGTISNLGGYTSITVNVPSTGTGDWPDDENVIIDCGTAPIEQKETEETT